MQWRWSTWFKAIRQMLQAQAAEQPYLISIGERAEAIVQAFEERQLNTQETLRQLLEEGLFGNYRKQTKSKTHLPLKAHVAFSAIKGKRCCGKRRLRTLNW